MFANIENCCWTISPKVDPNWKKIKQSQVEKIEEELNNTFFILKKLNEGGHFKVSYKNLC